MKIAMTSSPVVVIRTKNVCQFNFSVFGRCLVGYVLGDGKEIILCKNFCTLSFVAINDNHIVATFRSDAGKIPANATET
jgi:hypothetical protein